MSKVSSPKDHVTVMKLKKTEKGIGRCEAQGKVTPFTEPPCKHIHHSQLHLHTQEDRRHLEDSTEPKQEQKQAGLSSASKGFFIKLKKINMKDELTSSDVKGLAVESMRLNRNNKRIEEVLKMFGM